MEKVMKTLPFVLLLCMAAVAAGQQAYDLPPPPAAHAAQAGRHERPGHERVATPHTYRPAPGNRPYSVNDRYAAAPIGTVACSPGCAECQYPESHAASKAHHLREAAKHLEAAGYKEQAAEVLQKAHEQQQAHLRHRIDQMLIQIEMLKAELARLESHDDAQRQVQIDVKLLELAGGATKEDLDLACLDQAAIVTSSNFKFVGATEESDKVASAIEKLRVCGSVKVFAEPSLVTVSGRPASLRVGNPHPQRGPDGSLVLGGNCAGMQVDMLPRILADDKVRLEFKFHLQQPGESKPVVLDGKTNPRWRVVEIDTGAEIEAGKTLIIRSLPPGMESETDSGRKPQFLLLLTPKILVAGEIPKTARADADKEPAPPPQPLQITR
ncbi:MAG: hypothetical protein WD403_08855 [Pirellulales bacterium]